MSRKEEILDALGHMIESQGLQTNFTISELAKKVDIGKSTIYEYFSTKDQLISEAMIRIFEHAMSQIQSRQLDPNASFEENLKDELRFSFKLAKESSYIFRYLTPEFQDTIPSNMKGQFAHTMRKTTKRYEEIFRVIIEKGIQEGVLNTDNLVMKGVLFGSLISGSITHVTRANNGEAIQVDLERHIESIYQTVLNIFN